MRKKGKRVGVWRTAHKPSRKSRNKFLDGVGEWLARYQHWSVWSQANILKAKLKGYYAYFGLRYCLPALRHIRWHVDRRWITELRKRSQRHRLSWQAALRQPWFQTLPEPALRR